MAEFTIKISDYSPEVLAALQKQVEAALEAVGNQAVGYSQDIITENIPRHAGSWYVPQMGAGLRGSISHKVAMDESAVYVGTDNEHAIYNEYGTGIYDDGGGRQSPWSYKDERGNWHRTRGMRPIHFLRDAIAKHLDEYKQIIERYLRGG